MACDFFTGAVQLKELHADTPAADLHLKRSYSSSPTVDDETSDDSEDPKQIKINKSKKWVATPVTKVKAQRQSTQAAKIQEQKQFDEDLLGIFYILLFYKNFKWLYSEK